ncbi:MAG: CBS domain-containing protein [Actinomycetota bacterium]|nr:CBS domain-containing protein [Actinomycetota bacterium]
MVDLLAKDIMTKKVVTINQGASIKQLSELLIDNNISGVPVVNDEGKMVGIATEGDVIVKNTDLHFPRYFKLLDSIIYLESLTKFKNSLKKHLAIKVSEIMTTKVVSCFPETLVEDVVNLMVNNKVNRIPVISQGGEPIGIITRADIVKSMVQNK